MVLCITGRFGATRFDKLLLSCKTNCLFNLCMFPLSVYVTPTANSYAIRQGRNWAQGGHLSVFVR